MKKSIILIACLISQFFNLLAQEPNIDQGINKLALTLESKYWTKDISNVVFIGFRMKDDTEGKLSAYSKNIFTEALLKTKFNIVDPNVVDAIIKDRPWKLKDVKNKEYISDYEHLLFKQTDTPINSYLYGIIEDLGEKLILTAYLINDGVYTPIGSSTVYILANDKTNELLNKETTKINDNNETSGSSTTNLESENQQMRGGSDPLKGLKISEEKKALQIGTYYALIIGIDSYSGQWPKLQNAVRDAKAFEEMLKSKYKIDFFHSLYDQNATRENIINEFEWMVQNVKPSDNVVIYYSGHGEYKKDLNKGYWVPVNATSNSTAQYISNNDIQTYLGGIKSKHTLLISDACFSGDIFRGKTITIPYEESERYYSKVNNLISRKAITSGGIEPVMDGGKEGHSVFAYYLLKSLASNNSKFYDANQLYESIKIPVVNNSQQSPNFQPIRDSGDEGGQFIFIRK